MGGVGRITAQHAYPRAELGAAEGHHVLAATISMNGSTESLLVDLPNMRRDDVPMIRVGMSQDVLN